MSNTERQNDEHNEHNEHNERNDVKRELDPLIIEFFEPLVGIQPSLIRELVFNQLYETDIDGAIERYEFTAILGLLRYYKKKQGNSTQSLFESLVPANRTHVRVGKYMVPKYIKELIDHCKVLKKGHLNIDEYISSEDRERINIAFKILDMRFGKISFEERDGFITIDEFMIALREVDSHLRTKKTDKGVITKIIKASGINLRNIQKTIKTSTITFHLLMVLCICITVIILASKFF